MPKSKSKKKVGKDGVTDDDNLADKSSTQEDSSTMTTTSPSKEGLEEEAEENPSTNNSNKQHHKESVSNNETSTEDEKDKQGGDNNKDDEVTRDDANADDDDDNEQEQEHDDAWDLKKIMSINDINSLPIMCQTEGCSLLAAVLYVSTGKPPEKWYGCLDCQDSEFGGWPETLQEMPLSFMTQEHKDLLLAKCSQQQNVEMPVFPVDKTPAKAPRITTDNDNNHVSNSILITPLATHRATTMIGSSTLSQEVATTSALTTTAAAITPSPALASAVTTAKTTTTTKTTKTELSKAQRDIMAKWNETAQSMGGAKIIVAKAEAKKMIYDLLYEAFCPMNITQIHTQLKGVVPSPILKACLKEMALDKESDNQFADSDDDDEDTEPKKKKAKKTPAKNQESVIDVQANSYKGSLTYKEGSKGVSSSLYYVNYTITKNGDGLSRDDKNKLLADLNAAQTQRASMQGTLEQTKAAADNLLAEPTNEQAVARLEEEAAVLQQLSQQVDEARQYKDNATYMLQTKRRIDNMVSYWRKRRRLCMDFLYSMEELSEGTVSAKKCLAGDGQIELDSDEVLAKRAVEYGKKKRSRPLSMGAKRPLNNNNNKKASKTKVPGIEPSESFVAVLLDTHGSVKRVHIDDE